MSIRKLLNYAYWLLVMIAAAQLMVTGYFLSTQKSRKYVGLTPRQVTPESLDKFLKLSAQWLDRHVSAEGELPYIYYVANDVYDKRNQIVRQWFATLALGKLYKRYPTEQRKTAFMNNLRFNMEQYYREDGELAYFVYKGYAHLASNAVAARALAIAQMVDEKYAGPYQKIVLTMNQQISEYGPMDSVVYPHDKHGEDINFAPGVVMVAMVQAARLGVIELDVARMELVTAYYYRRWNEKRSLYGAPWMLQGFTAVWEALKDKMEPVQARALRDTIFVIADYLAGCQAKTDRRPEHVGAFSHPSCTEATKAPLSNAVRVEGLVSAYRVARAEGRIGEAKRYRDSARLGLRHILYAQINEVESQQYKNPHKAVGALVPGRGNPSVRIDGPGHTIMAVDGFLEHIGSVLHPQPHGGH